MARITIDQLTAELVREGGAIVAVAPSAAMSVPLRRDLKLPRMYSVDTPADVSPEAIEVVVRDYSRESLKEVQDRLCELGLGFGLEPLPKE